MKLDHLVAVTSRAFSKDPVLRQELLNRYSRVKFNDAGEKLEGKRLIEFLQNCECLILGLEKIDDALLTALPTLKVISKFGVGLDGVDSDAIKKHGVKLVCTPGVNRLSVAELTLCFMLALMRNVFQSSYLLKQGQWVKNAGHQLSGKTIGIVGVGHISKEVIKLLKPFECKILACDIADQSFFYQQEKVIAVDFETLVKEADIISLHVPLTAQTKNMVNEAVLNKMKSSAFLINVARGSIVDEQALKEALITKKIAGAALDVYQDEPPTDREFLELPNLICTPHFGGNAYEAILAMGRAAIQGLEEAKLLEVIRS